MKKDSRYFESQYIPIMRQIVSLNGFLARMLLIRKNINCSIYSRALGVENTLLGLEDIMELL